MTTVPEFSRPISIEGIMPDKPRVEKIEATEAECAALATRFGVRALSGLKSKMTILRLTEGKMVRVEGYLEADVVQSCVVSLQDVHARIEAHFDTCFTEDGKNFEPDDELDSDVEDELNEVMHGGMLDMGELVAQYLSLELDPYPRAPGVSLAAQMAELGIEVKNSPFQVLKKLKKKDE